MAPVSLYRAMVDRLWQVGAGVFEQSTGDSEMKRFEDLKGKTLVEIIGGIGDEEMVFVTEDGSRCTLFYDHD